MYLNLVRLWPANVLVKHCLIRSIEKNPSGNILYYLVFIFDNLVALKFSKRKKYIFGWLNLLEYKLRIRNSLEKLQMIVRHCFHSWNKNQSRQIYNTLCLQFGILYFGTLKIYCNISWQLCIVIHFQFFFTKMNDHCNPSICQLFKNSSIDMVWHTLTLTHISDYDLSHLFSKMVGTL